MKTVVSAGILIQDILTKQFLLVKPNAGTTGGWGIPKGKKDPGELLLATAIREVKEETALDFLDENIRIKHQGFVFPHPFFHYEVDTKERDSKKLHKHVYAFRGFVVGSKDIPLECTSLLENGQPEIAKFGWYPLEECAQLVVKSQRPIFEFLLEFEKHQQL